MITRIKSSNKLTTFIIIFPLITLLLYGGLSHIFFFYIQNNNAKQEIVRYEKTLMDAEKNNLIEKVENLTRFIQYYNSRSTDKIKGEVKSVISIAVDIVNNIYLTYKDKMDEDSLKELIINSLSRISFESDMGYLFLINTNGIALIHPDEKMLNRDISNIRDINGKYIIKEFAKTIKNSGEGFIDYYWYIANQDHKTMYHKISFVKTLDMYNWYIGAGEYLKYMDSTVKKDILKYIQSNALFKYGYFFISNSNNKIIYHPKQANMDELGKFRIEGMYEDTNHIAYTKYVAEYDWYVTGVKELKYIQQNIDIQKREKEEIRSDNISTNLYLLMLSWFISLLLSIYLSSIMNHMLRRYEDRLKDANDKLVFQSRQALIGELFSMIAHQWRQPINKIASILVLLRFRLPRDSVEYTDIDNKLQDIEDSVEFMSDTIDDFRTFYQPKEYSEDSNLKELLEKSIDYLEGNIRRKDIEIIKSIDDIVCNLHANELLQVMINLIKNATDAVYQRGIIVVKLYRQKNHIIISVEDNGDGIDPELLPKIFDPYFSTKSDSMGLGLYMSRMIVEKHLRGTIEAEMLEHGTKFTIRILVNPA